MKFKELLALLQGSIVEKEMVVLFADQDPIYFDSSDTEPNQILIVCDEYGSIQGVAETDENNKIVKSTLGVGLDDAT